MSQENIIFVYNCCNLDLRTELQNPLSQQLTELKAKIDNSTLVVEDFNI